MGFFIIFHRQYIHPCTVSKIIGWVIHVPFPITAIYTYILTQIHTHTPTRHIYITTTPNPQAHIYTITHTCINEISLFGEDSGFLEVSCQIPE